MQIARRPFGLHWWKIFSSDEIARLSSTTCKLPCLFDRLKIEHCNGKNWAASGKYSFELSSIMERRQNNSFVCIVAKLAF